MRAYNRRVRKHCFSKEEDSLGSAGRILIELVDVVSGVQTQHLGRHPSKGRKDGPWWLVSGTIVETIMLDLLVKEILMCVQIKKE